MLVNLSISTWSARKNDKAVSRDVIQDNNAAADAGRFNKLLIDSDALAEVIKVANLARAEHAAKTSPWLDSGTRILSAINYIPHRDTLNKAQAAFGVAVERFESRFDDILDRAKVRLGGMWNPADYPSRREIAGKFSFHVRRYNLPDAKDFRVDIGDAQAAEIRAEIERDMQDAAALATRDAYERIAEVVGAMAAKLAAYQPAHGDVKATGIFRDSLLSNVAEVAEALPGLNITGDPGLAAVTARIRATLLDYEPATLRESDAARRLVAAEAQSILDSLKDVLA
jgi:hypothetical protein